MKNNYSTSLKLKSLAIVAVLSAIVAVCFSVRIYPTTANVLSGMSNVTLRQTAIETSLYDPNSLPATSASASILSAVPITSAKSMITVEKSSGRVLFELNANQKLPMASTTKILTAICVIENSKLDSIVRVSPLAVGIEGSSVYLQAGEEISVEDLLYCMMLQSGNDAAVALAIHTSGSVEKFVQLMNKTAKTLGANDSNFVTVNGLHSPEHYTTSSDLAKISIHGLKNEVFRKIVSARSRVIKRTEGVFPVVIKNKNKLLKEYPNITGIKTGYTKVAGRCFVASSERNGMEIVSVVLNCPPMFEDCYKLLEAGHANFEMTQILQANTHIGNMADFGVNSKLNLYTKKDFDYPLTPAEFGQITARIDFDKCVNGNVRKNSKVGTLHVILGSRELVATDIFTLDEIKVGTVRENLRIIIDRWLNRN